MSTLSTSVDPGNISTAHRRLRAAAALLNREVTRAGNPYLPLTDRQHAYNEAQRHISAAWLSMTSVALEGNAPVAVRAAGWLGEVNRRLPLIASELRAAAGQPTSYSAEEAA